MAKEKQKPPTIDLLMKHANDKTGYKVDFSRVYKERRALQVRVPLVKEILRSAGYHKVADHIPEYDSRRTQGDWVPFADWLQEVYGGGEGGGDQLEGGPDGGDGGGPAVYAAISGGLPRLSLTRSTAAQSSSIPGALPVSRPGSSSAPLLIEADEQEIARPGWSELFGGAGPSSAGADADWTSYEGAVETPPFPTNALALLGLDVIPPTEDECEQILSNVEPSASVEQAKQEICAYLRAMQQIFNRTATRPGKRRLGN